MDKDKQLASMAEDSYGVFTRAEALGLGFTRSACDHRLHTGVWMAVHPAVYRLPGAPRTLEQRAYAACLAVPGSLASHETAANLWGIRDTDPSLHIVVPHKQRAVLADVAVHRTRSLSEEDRKVRHGIPVTSLQRTIIDLSACLGRDELVTMVEPLLAERTLPLSLLAARLTEMGTRGRSGSLEVARFIEERTERKRFHNSEPQRILEKALEARGLGGSYEFKVRLPDGSCVFIDVAFPPKRLAVEVNSHQHHSSYTAWHRDQVRNNALVALGWRIIVVTAMELVRNPDQVVDRIVAALAVA